MGARAGEMKRASASMQGNISSGKPHLALAIAAGLPPPPPPPFSSLDIQAHEEFCTQVSLSFCLRRRLLLKLNEAAIGVKRKKKERRRFK